MRRWRNLAARCLRPPLELVYAMSGVRHSRKYLETCIAGAFARWQTHQPLQQWAEQDTQPARDARGSDLVVLHEWVQTGDLREAGLRTVLRQHGRG